MLHLENTQVSTLDDDPESEFAAEEITETLSSEPESQALKPSDLISDTFKTAVRDAIDRLLADELAGRGVELEVGVTIEILGMNLVIQ